jgi:hypothetical protein
MSNEKMYKLTWYIYWRWVLGALAFAILVPLAIPIVEFPLMLLIGIVSRIFGMSELAPSILEIVNAWIFRPEVLGLISFVIGFFVLRAMLSRVIGKELNGKVLILQDASRSLNPHITGNPNEGVTG